MGGLILAGLKGYASTSLALKIALAVLGLMGYELEPCATDDFESVHCYWDAEARGNGDGASWINLDVTAWVEVTR